MRKIIHVAITSRTRNTGDMIGLQELRKDEWTQKEWRSRVGRAARQRFLKAVCRGEVCAVPLERRGKRGRPGSIN